MGMALATIDNRQIAALNRIEQHVARKRSELRAVVATIASTPNGWSSAQKAPAAQGGPFVPYKSIRRPGPSNRCCRASSRHSSRRRKLSLLARACPSPAAAGAVRDDKHLRLSHRSLHRSAAMHTGIDFRAETGTPVRATRARRVVTSAYQGGYGNMVEIDHGMGLTTRYAHLSALLVDEGEFVQVGTVVGRVGSTGRSTGPHLHYETRLDDDALDPRRFLRAGEKFAQAPNP